MHHLKSKSFTLQATEMLKTQVCCGVGNVYVLPEWLSCGIQLISNAAGIVFAPVKTVSIDQPLLAWQLCIDILLFYYSNTYLTKEM